jgi:hypothetical protein
MLFDVIENEVIENSLLLSIITSKYSQNTAKYIASMIDSLVR